MAKQVPVRQCVACREHREKPKLIRVVRTPEGQILLDLRGKASGRGAYLCRSAACLERAVKTRALARALNCEIPEETVALLRQQMKEAENG